MRFMFLLVISFFGQGILFAGPICVDNIAPKGFEFVENLGQLNSLGSIENAAFYSDFQNGRMLVNPSSLAFSLSNAASKLRLNFLYSNAKAELIGCEKKSYCNYYNNSKPIVKVPVYNKLKVNNLYDGISLEIYSNKNDELEFDFVISPGNAVSDVEIKPDTDLEYEMNGAGSVIFKQNEKILELARPYAFQLIDGKTILIESSYRIDESGVIGFRVGEYDKNHSLIIDPVTRIWGTYYGGEQGDCGKNIAVDWNGSVYLCGDTQSDNNIASPGALRESHVRDNIDMFIAKFDLLGNRLWATYFGGESYDKAAGIVVDKSGSVYIAGNTESQSGIAFDGEQDTPGGYRDAFIAKFDKDGALIWSSYFGGLWEEKVNAIAVDPARNIYITGMTKSKKYISTPGAYQEQLFENENDFPDAFVTKFNSKGERLWSTYYGGSLLDVGTGVAIDIKNNVIVSGTTYSLSNISSAGSHQEKFGGEIDGFFVKFDQNGNRLFASYLGGEELDQCEDIETDNRGNFYICGFTRSEKGITKSKENVPEGLDDYTNQQNINGENDAFLAKFDVDGNRIWSAYFGGESYDEAYSLDVDLYGSVYMAGNTNSDKDISTVPVFGSTSHEKEDAFLAKFNSEGEKMWSSYYGGVLYDYAFDIEVDNDRNIFLAGMTESFEGISKEGYQDNNSGGRGDSYLVRIADDETYIREVNPSGVNEDVTEIRDIQISPNPARNNIKISFYLSGESNIEIFISDLKGGKVVKLDAKGMYAGMNSLSINLNENKYSSLKSGAYFLNIQCGQDIVSKKFNIIK